MPPATRSPPTDNFFNANGFPGTTCTITETATGGAVVAYACEDDGVNASCASSGNAVTFDSPEQICPTT